MTNRGGFSWKRAVGVTRAKQKISRMAGVPLTKSGRQRKIGKMVTGGGCLLTILFSFIVSFVLVQLITGCSILEKKEFNRQKEEIIKFDKEYWKIFEENDNETTDFYGKISMLEIPEIPNPDDPVSITIERLTKWIEYDNKAIEINTDRLKSYKEYINKFKSLEIPDLMDNFYLKKIAVFDKTIELQQNNIDAIYKDLIYLDYYKKAAESDFTVDYTEQMIKAAEERDKLNNLNDIINKELDDLILECDQIREEIYMKYELYNLITKW